MKFIKKTHSLCWLASCLFFTLACTHSSLSQGKKEVLTIAPTENNPRNSEGDFIQLKDGRMLFVYSHYDGASSSDHAAAYLAGRFSADGGKTWSQKDTLILPNEGDMNVMSVSLLRLNDGQIAMFYLRKNSISDCIPMMRISKDEAKTWSKATPCITDKKGYFVLNNDRAIQLKNGRLLISVALHKTPADAEWSGKGRLWSYYSDDNGKTWHASREVPNPNHITLQEPGVVELSHGKIMMFIRTDAGVQYLSYSEDKGESWSPAAPSDITSPTSPASIERIPSTGDLVMVWNNNLAEDKEKAALRTPLNIAISKDEGKSWERIKTLENDPDGWYCYTAIDFVDDHILLGHCAGNRPKGTGLSVTQITRLDQDWLYQ